MKLDIPTEPVARAAFFLDRSEANYAECVINGRSSCSAEMSCEDSRKSLRKAMQAAGAMEYTIAAAIFRAHEKGHALILAARAEQAEARKGARA